MKHPKWTGDESSLPVVVVIDPFSFPHEQFILLHELTLLHSEFRAIEIHGQN